MILRKRIAILLAALMIMTTGVQATTMVAAAVDNDFAEVAVAKDGGRGAHNGTNKEHHNDNRDGGKVK